MSAHDDSGSSGAEGPVREATIQASGPDLLQRKFEVFQQRYTNLYRLVRSKMNRLGQQEDVEDIVQETFERLHKHGVVLDAEESDPWPLLVTTASNLIIDFFRRQARRRRRAPQVPLDTPQRSLNGEVIGILADIIKDPASAHEEKTVNRLHNKAIYERLAEEVQRLNPTQRECIVRWAQGDTAKTTATALGIPEGTVSSHIYRVQERLREALSGFKYDPSG